MKRWSVVPVAIVLVGAWLLVVGGARPASALCAAQPKGASPVPCCDFAWGDANATHHFSGCEGWGKPKGLASPFWSVFVTLSIALVLIIATVYAMTGGRTYDARSWQREMRR